MAANRFAKTKKEYAFVKEMLMPLLFFALVAGMSAFGLSSITKTTQREKISSLKQAITRSSVQCYALEGQYPPNLEYLQSHYGLTIDYDLYIVDYSIFASNIMPQIQVLPKYFGESGVGLDEQQ